MQLNETVLFESTGSVKDGTFRIKGVFSTPGQPNRNGRIYPLHLWEEQVAKFQKYIKEGTNEVLMELEHPEGRSEVLVSKASGRLTDLRIENGQVIGEAVIFNTPETQSLREMVKYGVKISVSSRALGSLDSRGNVTAFDLKGFDFVSQPSDYNAQMIGLIESLKKQEHKMHNLNEQEYNVQKSLLAVIKNKESLIESLNDEIERLRQQRELTGEYAVEDNEYSYRRAGEDQIQTHRHQDARLLNDTDPANNYHSGEDEESKIRRILLSILKDRTEVVGSVLGQDHNAGEEVTLGVAGNVEAAPAKAQHGLHSLNEVDPEQFLHHIADAYGFDFDSVVNKIAQSKSVQNIHNASFRVTADPEEEIITEAVVVDYKAEAVLMDGEEIITEAVVIGKSNPGYGVVDRQFDGKTEDLTFRQLALRESVKDRFESRKTKLNESKKPTFAIASHLI